MQEKVQRNACFLGLFFTIRNNIRTYVESSVNLLKVGTSPLELGLVQIASN